MASRREFVQGAGIAAASLAAGGAACAESRVNPFALHHAVFDERFAAARAFAAEAERRGWAVSAIRGDVTDLWRRDLAQAWRDGPIPVAGMTEDNSLFCLERLVQEAGLRLTCHRRDAADGLVSWMIGPPAPRA